MMEEEIPGLERSLLLQQQQLRSECRTYGCVMGARLRYVAGLTKLKSACPLTYVTTCNQAIVIIIPYLFKIV